MVGVTVKQNIQWHGAGPLWMEQHLLGLNLSGRGPRIKQDRLAQAPSILRFANDEFMDELIEVLDSSPRKLNEYLARPETWRKPMEAPSDMPVKETETAISHLLNRTQKNTQALKLSVNTITGKQKEKAAPIFEDEQFFSPIKLFQAAHQRHYLVSASLLLNDIGLPDNVVDLNKQEKVSFVVRRLVPPEEGNEGATNGEDSTGEDNTVPNGNWQEYAFVKTSRGHVWKRISAMKNSASKVLIAQEEQLSLFPTRYKGECCDRVIHSGLIPVGKREAWMAAPSESGEVAAASQSTGVVDSLGKAVFMISVAEPWRALINQAEHHRFGQSRAFDNFEDEDKADQIAAQQGADQARSRRAIRDNIQTASWYILLDFAAFLEEHLPHIWRVVVDEAPSSSLNSQQLAFFTLLNDTVLPANLRDAIAVSPISSTRSSLRTALADIKNYEEQLETVETDFIRYDENGVFTEVQAALISGWPDFLFPLADPEHSAPVPPTLANSDSILAGIGETSERDKLKLEAMVDLVAALLPASDKNFGDSIPLQTSPLQKNAGWFVIRCVYERPHCGPLFPPLLSNPSRFLEMSPFFDPDAPARPIRIPMPLDISPAGLRKYSKNTGFVLSDMLCGKVKGIRKYSLGDLVLSILPWPFHKDLPEPGSTGPCKKGGIEFGMICSLSIPIVTLCAFIMLIIMVTLFDIFFRWIPFLMLCLPIPGLKGKKDKSNLLS